MSVAFAFSLVALAIAVINPPAAFAAEPELPKFKSISEWLDKSTREDEKKCNEAKAAKSDLWVPAVMSAPYCWCLKEANWAADATKENFCRLHAILAGKPNSIGRTSSDVPDKKVKDFTFDAAPKEMQAEVHIRPPILSRDLLFSSSSLRWNQDTKELVFECNGDVELTATPQTMRILKSENKARIMTITPEAPTHFKYSAKIISETKGTLAMKKTTVKVDTKTEKCSIQFQKAEFLFDQDKKQDAERSAYAMKAFGGEDKVKQALIQSACDRFRQSVDFALDSKAGGAVKLLDLPSYNQL